MSPLGLISKEKFMDLQSKYEELRHSLDQLKTEAKNLKLRISELSESVEILSKKNKELTCSYHSMTKERDQVQAKLGKYAEERQLLQKMIHDLEFLARKRRKNIESSSDTQSFESDIQKLLEQTSKEHSDDD
jgi:chromosome segregation ATPase